MQDTEILSKVLNLGERWHVQSIDIDEPSNRIDISISFGPAKRRFFFGRAKADDYEDRKIVLRHLPVASMRTFLHVPQPNNTNGNKVWGAAGSKFTNEMEAFVVHVLNNTKSNQIAAKIAGITSAEAREISERTGAGSDNLAEALSTIVSATGAATAAPAADYAEAKSFELIESTNIPPETHDNWQRVINGEIVLQTDTVGLQMLLQRVRQDVANNPSEVTRINAAKLLRQYFVKNRNLHSDELAIISGQSAQAAAAAVQTELPADTHAIWQNIINGTLPIQTSNVALQMMLERVKRSVEKTPSESSRQAGAKILHQFFIKYKDRLTDEVRQMGIGVAAPVAAPTGVAPGEIAIPGEDATCWLDLLNGEFKIDTGAIGLQMMLERLRQSIERNNTTANRTAGISILRQYFIKHQAASQNEILQLNERSGLTPVAGMPVNGIGAGAVAVPPENHPNWQRLINGDLVLDTDIVALKMMLQSIRISIENNPTEASRHNGARILRQYFIKHQNKHKTELDQLIAA